MNIHPQIILKRDMPEYVVLPYKEYQSLLNALEDREDIHEIEAFRASGQQTIPFKLLQTITDGANPVKVFREFRKISQAKLAKNVGITPQYLCQIENNQRKGNAKVLKKIAQLLDIDFDLLV